MKKQIKTKLSRILCTALALCMIAALIPAAFATTTEEAEEFSIDFLTFATANNNANHGKAVGAVIYDDSWELHESTVVGGAEFNKSYGLAIKAKNDKNEVGKYVAFKFTAPASGTFDITYVHAQAASGTTPSGGKGDVYILDEGTNIATAISGTEGLMFDEVIYYASKNNNSYKEPEKAEITLTAGEKYLLVFVVTGAGEGSVESTQYRQYPGSLTFTDARWNDVKAVYSFSTEDKDADNGYDKSSVITPDMITYENSDGRVEFDSVKSSETGNLVSQWSGGYACIDLNKPGEYAAYKIRIPKEGFYNLNLDYYIVENSTVANVYLFPVTQGLTEGMDSNTPVISELNFADGTTKTYSSKAGEKAFYAEKAGEYYLVFECTKTQKSGFVRPGKLTLNGSKNSTATEGAPVAGINIEKTVFEEGDAPESFTITANDSATGAVIQEPQIENLKSADTSVIDIDATNNNQVIVKGPGVATITADVNGYPASVTLTVNDAALTEAFSDVEKTTTEVPTKAEINILTYSIDGTQQTYEDTVEAEYNEATSITAPDLGDDYKFLYWAKGTTAKKQIIPGETCAIYPMVGVTYLIAVYEPINAAAADKVEFYNYNGQLLDCVITQDDKMPELPYMTGYGKADRWAHYGSDVTYGEGVPAPETSGTAIFVAQYNDLEENITVTAKNCTVNGESSVTVKYGDEVECIANGDGDKVFKWWTKTDEEGKTEIVSLDTKYTFKAWETCTVEAVYGDKAPTYVGDTMRIILDELTVGEETAYMAEFVGLDCAVEKGIMLGTTRYAMSSKDNQFTIINDEGATEIKGYAILSDGTLITDN